MRSSALAPKLAALAHWQECVLSNPLVGRVRMHTTGGYELSPPVLPTASQFIQQRVSHGNPSDGAAAHMTTTGSSSYAGPSSSSNAMHAGPSANHQMPEASFPHLQQQQQYHHQQMPAHQDLRHILAARPPHQPPPTVLHATAAPAVTTHRVDVHRQPQVYGYAIYEQNETHTMQADNGSPAPPPQPPQQAILAAPPPQQAAQRVTYLKPAYSRPGFIAPRRFSLDERVEMGPPPSSSSRP